MRVDLRPYSLAYRSAPKSLSEGLTKEGVLIRMTNNDGTIGYSSLQSWPLLGDPSLEVCVKDILEQNIENNLVRKSLLWAQSDAFARSKGVSLFEGLTLPKSHYLLTNVDQLTAKKLESILKIGFDKIKVKIGGDLERESDHLVRLCQDLIPRPLFRLDLNGQKNVDQVALWLSKYSDLLKYIDFIEDPCAVDRSHWAELKREFKIQLALDWDCEEVVRENLGDLSFFDILVLKPANCGCAELLSQIENHPIRYMVTSYLDHPVGQAFAAWEAARLAVRFPNIVECGLLTHSAFHDNDPFIKGIDVKEGRIDINKADKGIGFTSLLNSEFLENL